MQRDVMWAAAEAIYNTASHLETAKHIQAEADRMFGGPWQCAVVGKEHGSVSLAYNRCCLMFEMGPWKVYLWRAAAYRKQDDDNW